MKQGDLVTFKHDYYKIDPTKTLNDQTFQIYSLSDDGLYMNTIDPDDGSRGVFADQEICRMRLLTAIEIARWRQRV